MPLCGPCELPMATVKKVALERFYVTAQRAVAFHDVKFDRLVDIAEGLALELNAYVWAEKLQDEQVALSVSYPSSWWEHFKQRWFPRWALSRWPVRKTEITRTHRFKTLALLPEFNYEAPRGCGTAVVMSMVTT